MSKFIVLISLVAFNFAGNTVSGQIANAGGSVSIIAPPPTVDTNQFEGNDRIRAFVEHKEIALTDNLIVDISAPGTYDSIDDNTPSILNSGTTVSSSYIHFDPIGQSNLVTRSGFITFEREILGVMFQSVTIDPSHTQLGHPGTVYPTFDVTHDFGADYDQDIVIVSNDLKTLFFQFSANFSSDDLRVVTAVPEPSSASLLTIALLGSIQFRRRRNKR